MNKKIVILLSVILVSFGLGACSTHFDTSKKENSSDSVLYKLTQEQSFSLAYNAIVSVLPGRKISNVDGAVKGYSTWSRFVLDTYTQQVMVIPAQGETKSGETVAGFYFEISGSGSSGSGRQTNVRLYETIQEELDQMNVGVPVTSLQKTSYNGSVFDAPASNEKSAESRLKELDRLLEQKLITEDEYKTKRTNVLQSL